MEVLRGRTFDNNRDVQRHFDRWRDGYNLERPHEALGMQVPASRYLASARPYPQSLLPIEYGPDDFIRKVQAKGHVHYRSQIDRSRREQHQLFTRDPFTENERALVTFTCLGLSEIDLVAQSQAEGEDFGLDWPMGRHASA